AKTRTTAKEMGAELGADYVLRGAVRWSLNGSVKRAQLTVNLISVADGATTWSSDPIEFSPASDPFEVQRTVATSIAERLNIVLTPEDKAVLAERQTSNPAAYDAYLRGVAAEASWVTAAELTRAAAHYSDATRLDPAFNQARARWIMVQIVGGGAGAPMV